MPRHPSLSPRARRRRRRRAARGRRGRAIIEREGARAAAKPPRISPSHHQHRAWCCQQLNLSLLAREGASATPTPTSRAHSSRPRLHSRAPGDEHARYQFAGEADARQPSSTCRSIHSRRRPCFRYTFNIFSAQSSRPPVSHDPGQSSRLMPFFLVGDPHGRVNPDASQLMTHSLHSPRYQGIFLDGANFILPNLDPRTHLRVIPSTEAAKFPPPQRYQRPIAARLPACR